MHRRSTVSAERRKKREVLAEQGIDPYPLRFDRSATADELPALCRPGGGYPNRGPDKVAGRVRSIRGHGKFAFASLKDVSGRIQLLMSESALSEPAKQVRATSIWGTGSAPRAKSSPADEASSRWT